MNQLLSLRSLIAQPSMRMAGTLTEEALYGLAGDVVRTIEPHSEPIPSQFCFSFLWPLEM